MSFEPKLRRLAKKLPESEVPAELYQRVLSQLPPIHSQQKGHFTMKLILIPALAIALGGGGGLLFVRSTQTQPGTAQRTPVQTGPITLHVVNETKMPISGASVTLWRYQKPDPQTGVAPPLRAEQMPVGRTNENGDLALPAQGITHFQASFERGPNAGSDGPVERLFAAGGITVSEGQQVIVLSKHPVHTITGRFVDGEGNPLMGAKPELFVVDSQTTQSLMTYPDGFFIAWVVPGNEYRISLTQPNYAPYFLNGIRLNQGESRDLGTITLK